MEMEIHVIAAPHYGLGKKRGRGRKIIITNTIYGHSSLA
jgi:hypothetical protein